MNLKLYMIIYQNIWSLYAHCASFHPIQFQFMPCFQVCKLFIQLFKLLNYFSFQHLCYHLSKYLTFICTLCVISSDPISVYATFSTLQIFSIQLASNIQCSVVFTNFKWNIVIVSKKSKSFRMLTKQCWRYKDGASS